MLKTRISLVIALGVVIGQVIFAHLLVKLPSTPYWASPAAMYDNFAFALALGLGIPAPQWSGLAILLLTGWITYRISRWIMSKTTSSVAGN